MRLQRKQLTIARPRRTRIMLGGFGEFLGVRSSEPHAQDRGELRSAPSCQLARRLRIGRRRLTLVSACGLERALALAGRGRRAIPPRVGTALL